MTEYLNYRRLCIAIIVRLIRDYEQAVKHQNFKEMARLRKWVEEEKGMFEVIHKMLDMDDYLMKRLLLKMFDDVDKGRVFRISTIFITSK